MSDANDLLDLLKGLRGLDPLKQLFWTELNYRRVDQPLSRRGWTETAAAALADDPLLLAAGGENNAFEIIYTRLKSDKLLLTLERPAVSTLLRDHPYALFVVSDSARQQWHFINVRHDKDVSKRHLFRRITVGKDERLRTAAQRLEMLDLSGLADLSPLGIQQQHDDAFDVEAVTRLFFDDCRGAFQVLWDDLKRQSRDKSWAHDYALQFLNRCMFLTFIQRKGWLGDDREFLRCFWQSYNRGKAPKDTFVDKWLNVLFFKAFNNKLTSVPRYFPEEVRDALGFAPYLNGGLFSENELDRKCQDVEAMISDKRFEQVLGFLERYNFTLAEDGLLDREIAVDPEMIGKVYEILVNASEEADERGDAGIFYTPRTEIDLMCRLSVVDHLANHLGAGTLPSPSGRGAGGEGGRQTATIKDLLYQLVFSLEPEEKLAADKEVAAAGLWRRVGELLRDITALDPACGSGSFLAGMLHVLDDLQQRANRQLGVDEGAYVRKRRIIGQSIYGVDVMDWACHAAELRLWLSLIVHADYSRQQLRQRREPLLPHFSCKIRCGDSLVQEIGGLDLRKCARGLELPEVVKRRITRLKNEKLKFYANDQSCRFKSDAAVRNEEAGIFRDLLNGRADELRQDAKKLVRLQAQRPARQQLLDRSVEDTGEQLTLDRQGREAEIARLMAESEEVAKLAEAVRRSSDVFVWDIAFVEIFAADKAGFDIVVGNPPYVRQENIADPLLPREKVTGANKKQYKARLAQSVYQLFPRFFGCKPGKGTVARKLDRKCDLYVYFCFRALSLLNPKGAFCFITSNSWLDVGYGKDLQELLLRQCQIKLILDNEVKRSFASAAVNTAIALLSPPDARPDRELRHTAKFLLLRIPFEQVLSPRLFLDVESRRSSTSTGEYRLSVVSQDALLREALADTVPDQSDDASLLLNGRKQLTDASLGSGHYVGNKLGGKYLRAPRVYFDILASRFPMVRLGSQKWWSLGRGRRTGCDDFFYLDREDIDEWRIEKRFLRPLAKSPAEFSDCGPATSNGSCRRFIFLCHEPKGQLKGTSALRYILDGEKSGVNRRSLQSAGGRWYDLGEQPVADIILPIALNDRFFVVLNDARCEVHQRFATIILDEEHKHLGRALAAMLHASVFALAAEILGRRGLGQGALDFPPDDWRQVAIPDIAQSPKRDLARLAALWSELAMSPPMHIEDALQDDLHRRLDHLVLTLLGLDQGLLPTIHEELYRLTASRLAKAISL